MAGNSLNRSANVGSRPNLLVFSGMPQYLGSVNSFFDILKFGGADGRNDLVPNMTCLERVHTSAAYWGPHNRLRAHPVSQLVRVHEDRREREGVLPQRGHPLHNDPTRVRREPRPFGRWVNSNGGEQTRFPSVSQLVCSDPA